MIRSMTAYARREIKGEWGSATWEMRSVNQRYLETYFRPSRNTKLSIKFSSVSGERSCHGINMISPPDTLLTSQECVTPATFADEVMYRQ